MPKPTKLFALLSLSQASPELLRAQYAELQRQVPLMYALLMVNACAVAFTHYEFAPVYLSVGVVSVLFSVCGIRIVMWLSQRSIPDDPALIARQLRRTVVLAGVISIAFIAWSLALDRYGGPYERGHVALYIAITVIGCIFCLTHLPQAALVVTAIVTVPYLVHYLTLDDPVFFAMALNIFLVTCVMIQVVLYSFQSFAKLVESQVDVAAKSAETQALSEENARLAQTDSLTGLPNRRYFFAQMERMIERSRADGRRFAVGLVDLDRFKPVNDTYGHILGDELLADVAVRMVHGAGGSVTVCRLGGDEFGLLIADDVDEAAAETLGQHFCDLLAQPFEIDDVQIVLGGSCGLAVFPDAGDDAPTLFDRCDYALYHSKSQRRGQATVFSIEHEIRIRADRAIETALQSATISEEMEVHFQPIVDIVSGHVVSVEALARWNSSTLGRISPDVFIAVAERSGLISGLTLMLFRKALADWSELPGQIKLCFNLSAHDVTSSETVLGLITAIRSSGVEPGRITFELTETAVMRNFEVAARAIGLLRSFGVRVALDDFGTGYSSLGYLHRLPIDRLKIDRSFIADLTSPSGRNIVTAIVGLCRDLKLDCIVEGVESGEQLAEVKALGCRLAQGYLFSQPMPAGQCASWIEARDERAATG
ncbi:putative bifunctional diguanylate cyclase/phosphodiesterase [Mangrovicella endophytica]|uniref:putative bifunctional diguanylate cyclase/phosphodiesterase n=1 Tax=Mangrovicella endophytica TaxID=2066697 RepID=UPI0018E42D82|nr:EAL domain-containing protein [Mangrovicella endophytica]